MKEGTNKLDEYFRKKLGDQRIEPSKAVWKGIASKFQGMRPGFIHLLNFQNSFWALTIMGAGVATYLLWPSRMAENPQAAAPGEVMTLTLQNESVASTSSSGTVYPVTDDQPAHGIPAEPMVPAVPVVVNEFPSDLQQPLINSPSSSSLNTENEAIQERPEIPVHQDPQSIETGITPLLSLKSHLPRPALPDPVRFSPQKPIQWKDDYGVPAQFSTGLSFQPEWINYRTGGPLKNSFSQQIDATFHIKDFMIRTGCGLTRAQDDGNYAVTYQKYEQVGFYVDITSFTGIEGYPDSVVFETRVVEVYDTVYHNDQVMTDNSYTYLQVPLQAGYRFFAAKRLSVYAMAGPAFTYLLNENKSAPVYESYGAQNVSVDDNTPVRSKFSWQLLFGLGAEYKITDKISISAEPTFRQYFKTAYEGNPTQKLPYSWGVRAGIHFNF